MEVVSARETLTIRNGWIFSPRFDFLYFYLPCMLGWLLVLYNSYNQLDNIYFLNRSYIALFFAFAAFLDTGHILSTILQVYLDKEERTKYKRKLIIAPIFFLALNLGIYFFFGMKYLLYFFGYFNYYHIIKQQYGWMAYSTRKSGFFNKTEFLYDKIFLYAFMVIPFIWAHFGFAGIDKTRLGIFLGNYQGIAIFLKNLFFAIVVLFVVKQIIVVVMYRTINLNKLLLITSTMFTWGAVIYLQSPFLVFITSIMHSIPYLALAYFYGEKRARTRQQKSLLFWSTFSYILFPLLIFSCGYLYTHLLRFLTSLDDKKSFALPLEVLSIVLSVAFFMHYYLDGIIWKRRNFKAEQL